MRRHHICFMILMLYLLSACGQQPAEHAETSASNSAAISTPSDAVAREPAEVQKEPVKYEVEFAVEKLQDEPVPVFDREHTVVETGVCGDITFTIYQLKGDAQYYLYITVGGVHYDFGAVDEGVPPIQDMVFFRNYLLQLTEIRGETPVYKLRSGQYMLNTTTYFTIRNNMPVVLYSIENVAGTGDECDLDQDGEMETVCNHGGTTSPNYWIYEWNVNSGEVHIADAGEQLGFDEFVCVPLKGYFVAGTREKKPFGNWTWTVYRYRDSSLVATRENLTERPVWDTKMHYLFDTFSIFVDLAVWKKETDRDSWKGIYYPDAFLEVVHLDKELTPEAVVETVVRESKAALNEAPILPDSWPCISAASISMENGQVQEMYFSSRLNDGTFLMVRCGYDPDNAEIRQSCRDSVESFVPDPWIVG